MNNGDTLTVGGNLRVGNNRSGTFTQNGGSASIGFTGFFTGLSLGFFSGSTGIYNLNGGSVATPQVYLGGGINGGSTGTFHLNGGTLTTTTIFGRGDNSGSFTFNFNGGTLRAAASDSSTNRLFQKTVTRAQVRIGGAVIDTAGFNVTIPSALVHLNLSGEAEIDGGLTKNGAGTLTLTGNNTYTGPTTVSAGVLVLGNGTASFVFAGRAGRKSASDPSGNVTPATSGTAGATIKDGAALGVATNAALSGGAGGESFHAGPGTTGGAAVVLSGVGAAATVHPGATLAGGAGGTKNFNGSGGIGGAALVLSGAGASATVHVGAPLTGAVRAASSN